MMNDGSSSVAARRRPRVLLGLTGSVATVKWPRLLHSLREIAEVRFHSWGRRRAMDYVVPCINARMFLGVGENERATTMSTSL